MADTKGKRKKRREKQLIEAEGDDEENGVANPIMTAEGYSSDGLVYSGGETSEPENVEDIEQSETLAKDLKSKHSQKQRELSQVTSPKDDLAKELRTVKKKSKQKVEETIRLEAEEEERAAKEAAEGVPEVAEDGTLPMPAEEAEEPSVTFKEGEEEGADEESKIKKLKKKKKTEEEEVMPLDLGKEEEEEAAKKEEEPAPPPPEEEKKEPPKESKSKMKLKDRLKKAKDAAKSEVEKEAAEERREKRLKREQKTTRFDTEKYDEAEFEALEERTKRLRERWKKLGQPTTDRGLLMPTQEEAFDFFTRNWDPEPEEEVKEEVTEKAETEKEEKDKEDEDKKEEKDEEEAGPSGEKKEGEEDIEEVKEEKEEEGEEGKKEKEKKEKAEDKKPLLEEEEVGDFEDQGYGMVAVCKAEYEDNTELLKKEAEILFVPSTAVVPAEKKVSEEIEPRFLEDEGFYVGTRPDTLGRNVNKMENRLLKEPDGRRWFGEDGRMIALPNPLRPSASRPPVPEEKEPYLETVFKGAILREFDSKYIDGSVDNTGFYQLDVDINSITFSHHHLFSREHVLATHLGDLYEQFLERQRKNMTEYLTEKLKALKSSALHLREHILAHKSEQSYADRSNFERRLKDYKFEIRRARELRDKEEEADRKLLKGIIHTWKEIKAQRDKQQYSNTSLKLQVRREEVDKVQDQLLWKNEMEEELEEMREEHADTYNTLMQEYEEKKKAVQNQRKAKEEATKRQKKRARRDSKASKQSKQSQRSKMSTEAEQTPEQIQADQDILNEEDLPEPEEPSPFDEQEARDKVKAKAMEIRRRPGEPKLHPELTNTAPITSSAQCPRGEQQRRDEVLKCKIFVKILFNNKEVSRTTQKNLTQDFKVTFGQIFNIKIVQWPECIKYEIYENIGFKTEMIAELYVGIPEVSITSQGVQLESLDFSSNIKVSHPKSHEGVGSGVPFAYGTKTESEMVTIMTTGDLVSSVAWAVDDNGQPLVPPMATTNKDNLFSAMKKMDPLSAVSSTGAVDIEKLAKWFEESRLDPNDPANADLVYMLKPKGGDLTRLKPPEYFRLDQLQEEFNVATDEEIESNKRFMLLQLRDQEIQEFRNYKMVPLNIRDIPRDTFTEYEKKKQQDEKLKEKQDDIESQRADVAKFMQRVREKVFQRFRMLAHQKRLDDVINEDAVPNIAMIGTSLLRLTERRRPLRPERKERKKATAQVLKEDEVKILVNITRALYIPVRTFTTAQSAPGMTAREPDKAAPKSIVGDTLVQPFVEVMFQHKCVRTLVGDGPNPSFNEELQIPLKVPNDDYSSSNLQQVNEDLFLNLFDEVVVDMQQDDRERATTVHQRIEKKWLGSLTIPFSTIYYNGKIEGTFCVKSPPILLGYTHDLGGGDEMNIGRKEENTYLSLFITIEPPLVPSEPIKEKFSSNEDEKLLQYAEAWQADLSKKFPKREYKTTVIDMNGKSVFITRYFRALKPPDELASGDNQRPDELAARFVSLIPFVSDATVFQGLCDIWSTCDTFLRMLAGDEEEHAVLLVNYFLSLEKKAWLVLGTAIPEGATAYVMTQEDNDYWIWNAGTGLHCSYRDNYCPLQTVGCLVNQDNIWANIQQYDKPAQMNFDVTDSSSWKPFFSKSFPGVIESSNQPEALRYFKTDERFVHDLAEKIENMLKNKIMEWRSRYITRWNRHCTQIMRKILPVLEQNLGRPPAQQQLNDLEHQFASYKVSGFPINMPFKDITDINETVFSTGVHAHETSDVEFALAVYIHPYPNSVLSVWIYVASLIRNR